MNGLQRIQHGHLSVEASFGQLAELRVVPMQTRRMRLHRACGADGQWTLRPLDRISGPFGTRAGLERDGVIRVGRR